MLGVNLHLLWMLQNVMTALKDIHVYTMYSCSFYYYFFFHFISNESSEALNELEHHRNISLLGFYNGTGQLSLRFQVAG